MSLPWSPDGVWTAEATGIRNNETVTAALTLEMLRGNVFATPDPSVFRVDVQGLWRWSGFEGVFEGYWLYGRDDEASSGTACPDNVGTCSVVIRLFPEDAVCEEGESGQTVIPIELAGWFDGADRIVAASLAGTFRAFQFAPPPCTGDVLISFETEVALTRS